MLSATMEDTPLQSRAVSAQFRDGLFYSETCGIQNPPIFVLSLCLVAHGHALGGVTFRFRCSFIGSQLCSFLRLTISETLHEFLLFQSAHGPHRSI